MVFGPITDCAATIDTNLETCPNSESFKIIKLSSEESSDSSSSVIVSSRAKRKAAKENVEKPDTDESATLATEGTSY